MYLNALGQSILVINSLKSAAELLDQRTSIYSSRPRLIMGHEVLAGGLFTAFLPYGDLWRRARRAAHQGLTKLAVRKYDTILRKESVLLASALLKNPEAFKKHFERSAASSIMSILYNYPTLETEYDKTLKEIHSFIERMSRAAAPGEYLVELFPWMMYIPERFAKWKYEGRRYFTQHTTMFESLFNQVRDDISNGSERPSMSATLIKNPDRNGLSNREMAWLVGTLYSAGAETTSTTMDWWALAMIANPEVQKHAQAELDAVVGRSRAPTFSDAPHLPYIQAMVKETLRWRPALPLALPHTTTEDDWYNGMFIPKGTMCLANLWHCHHDPAYYGDDAASFNPQRFLDAEGKLIPGSAETRDEGHGTYGFGRRACVGKHVANESLFIYMATILWAAKLERVRDQHGYEVPLDMVAFVDTGMVFKPVPYSCQITPRFPEVPSILEEEKENLKT
ncbi:cytochrome P450 [Multifurca ochricompacta]|uniref:Cytochrome P450 n=1 Tax=Multifurca ochricompacta TaxID=376703 RepID=A0AAD4M381_9AGAM|nr:cytochrome P450 [Multifurca ochricompacta]KAI0298080.1 cytochrome P450 [Multifurca ochricompacta]